MKEEVIGRRYAKALILLGKEQNNWEEIGKDLETFVGLFEENPILRGVLCDPVHERKKRKAVLSQILGRLHSNVTIANFLSLLVDKERIRYLPSIFKIYRQLEDHLAGRLRARIITVQKMDRDQTEAIKRALEARFNKKILLEESEDPAILGGIVCKVDGMVFDGSVRTQLEILKDRIKGE